MKIRIYTYVPMYLRACMPTIYTRCYKRKVPDFLSLRMILNERCEGYVTNVDPKISFFRCYVWHPLHFSADAMQRLNQIFGER